MATDAGVPVLPVAVWGTQRLWTKGRPRTLTRRHVPDHHPVGEPMDPAAYPDASAMTAGPARSRLTALVDRAQREYPDAPAGPDDTWWLPAHLGGTAPTLEEAAELEVRRRAAAKDPWA